MAQEEGIMSRRTANILGTLIGLTFLALGCLLGYLPCMIR